MWLVSFVHSGKVSVIQMSSAARFKFISDLINLNTVLLLSEIPFFFPQLGYMPMFYEHEEKKKNIPDLFNWNLFVFIYLKFSEH